MSRETWISWCHADNVLTLAMAYDIVNDVRQGCRTCEQLAWLLVGDDMDRLYGPVTS